MRFGAGLWTLQATASAPRHPARAYEATLEDARVMDDLGYEAAWLSEHHFFYDGYCPALLPTAASLLSVTRRLKVATGMLLAPFQDPHRLASMSGDLHSRSGGRFELGLGLGYRDIEFDGKRIPRTERVERRTRALDALTETAPDVPLWVGSATPKSVAAAGERGIGVLFSGANPLSLVRDLADAHREGWERAGRPGSGPPSTAALRNVWIVDTPSQRDAVLDWFRASYVLYAGLGWSVAPQGETAAMDFQRDVEKALKDAVSTAIVGSPQEVVEGLKRVEEAGVDYVVFRVAIEGAPQHAIHEVLRRLAEEVIPELGGFGS